MSVKVSSWVWHGDETAELSGNEMILLLALADVADDNGRCRFLTDDDDFTYAGLAKKARVDRSTAIRVVARLRTRGLVEQEKGARGRQNEFAIVVPWRRGGDLPPVEKVATATEKVASGAGKGGISDTDSSYRRTDVDVTPVVPSGDDVDEVFETVWILWPAARRGTTKVVRAKLLAAKKTVGLTVVVDAVRRDVAVWRGWPAQDTQYIPLLSTWLNQGRWELQAAAQPRGGSTTSYEQGAAVHDILVAREQKALRA